MKYPKDRFDDFPASLKRRGAHRAPRGRGSKLASWLIALASFVLLVGIGVGVMWMIDRQVQFTTQETEETTPETTAAETATPEETPTPTAPEATQDPNIAVTVLNGAGISRLAGATSDLLTSDSWNVVTVTDADTSDYTTTIVAVGSEDDLGAALGVVESLGVGEAQVDKDLAQPGEIVVIVGTDAESLLD